MDDELPRQRQAMQQLFMRYAPALHAPKKLKEFSAEPSWKISVL
jgi:hypothetical protein